ncbi:hypothetical protein BACCIP111883_02325 [Sutcliffiella rhizosphaerae]|uniref:Uncharacterized protein n=1 Tax=Sutcliffiella rhizosphaerae TaxID=2880967 RepID=A0ABM8YP81_9BACI|nr:hypothetical protein BACCIP111883_02325 [Sutcliffiella rhizosphaerae]
MINMIKAIPEKVSFLTGLILILVSPLVLFLISHVFPISDWILLIIGGVVHFFAILFILNAADKRHLRIRKM